MTKINQISTTTTRTRSTLQTNERFASIVWLQQIDKLNGFNYTQKKFLQRFIHNRIKQGSMFSFSALELYKDILTYYIQLQSLLLFGTITDAEGVALVNEDNPKMYIPNGKLRIQKIIRLALYYIQTERDIRKDSSYWQKRFGENALLTKNSEEHHLFARHMLTKVNVFFARLAVNVNKSLSHIVHTCEPKSFLSSRAQHIRFLDTLTAVDPNKKHSTISLCRSYLKSTMEFIDFVICYDDRMDRYIKYTNILPVCAIQSRMISMSLQQDIVDFLRASKTYAPTKMQKQNAKDFNLNKTINLIGGYMNLINRVPVSEKQDRHFTINSRGEMSYTPGGKPTYLSSDKSKWLAGADRMVTKYGKGVRKILAEYPIKIPDYLIEIICNKLKAKHTFVGDFKVVSGEDIKYWYDGRNYALDTSLGSLAGSCMKYQNCQPYMDFYVQNANKVKMLICTHMNKLLSRALIWTTDCGATILDRIYGTDKYINAMINYGNNAGYIRKKRQSYEEATTWVTPTGQVIEQDYYITTKIYPFQKLPYMDTFYACDVVGTTNTHGILKLSNHQFGDSRSLRSTSGSYTPAMERYSQAEKDNHEHHMPPHQEHINDDEVCLHDGTVVHEDDAGYCEHFENYYHIDDLFWCEADQCHYHNSVCFEVNGNYYYNENSYDNLVFVDSEDTWYESDDTVAIYDCNGDFVEHFPHDSDDYVYDNYLERDINISEAVRTIDEEWCHLDNTVILHSEQETYYVHHRDDIDRVREYFEDEDITLTEDSIEDMNNNLR